MESLAVGDLSGGGGEVGNIWEAVEVGVVVVLFVDVEIEDGAVGELELGGVEAVVVIGIGAVVGEESGVGR